MNDTERLRVLAKKPLGQKLSIRLEPRGSGSLIARRTSSGITLYYQYKHDGKLTRIPFGNYDRSGNTTGLPYAGSYTLNGAAKRARQLSLLADEHGNLLGYLKQHRAENARAIEARRQAEEKANQNRLEFSLDRLCAAYVEHLQAQGKASARSVENTLQRWVIHRHPDLATKLASDITADDIMAVLTTMIDAGITTGVNRLRSHLSAAFRFAISARANPMTSGKARGFLLSINPVDATRPVQQFEKTSNRVLSDEELAELVRTLEDTGQPKAQAALLALRLGGQRVTQLLAVTTQDIDRAAHVLTIRDAKGRRTEARAHRLPFDGVEPSLIDALAARHPRTGKAFNGLTHDTVSKFIQRLGDGEQPYTWRDVRRTVETRLARLGIHSDICAQLLSHGLTGVQVKHYNRHDYLDEKRAALKAWNDHLDALRDGEQLALNVVQLAR